MPVERKVRLVADLQEKLSKCTMVIAADYRGLKVASLTDLRRRLRDRGCELRVVKNSLASLAAQNIGHVFLSEVIQGPTALVMGFDDGLAPAQVLEEYQRATRTRLTVHGGIMGVVRLSPQQVTVLATLPSREQLIAQLLGQLQAPLVRLAYVLKDPIQGLAIVLQRHLEQRQAAV